jgi:hypothetical protein
VKKNAIIAIKLDRSYLFDGGGKALDHAGDVLQVRVLDVLTNAIRVVTLDGQRGYEVKKALVQGVK